MWSDTMTDRTASTTYGAPADRASWSYNASFLAAAYRIAAKTHVLVAGFLAATLSSAMAQGGNLQPVQSTLQQLIQVLTGPIATSLAILAVIALGMMAWVGRLTWYFAGSIIFGIVLVFGSTQIVQFFQSAVGR
jgi:type IV secretion system protein VirB2